MFYKIGFLALVLFLLATCEDEDGCNSSEKAAVKQAAKMGIEPQQRKCVTYSGYKSQDITFCSDGIRLIICVEKDCLTIATPSEAFPPSEVGSPR